MHPRIEVQATVNATYMYDMYLQDRRRGTGRPIYNLDPTDLGVRNMLRGELAFSSIEAVKMYGMKSRYRNPNIHAVPVWSAFNGLLQNEKVVFQGIVLKGYHGGVDSMPLGGEHQHVSCQVSGTTTIFNTSPDTIAAGQIVYWDYPDKVNNQPTTLFGNDTPSNKFVAKVCSSNMTSRIRRITSLARRGLSVEEIQAEFSGQMLKAYESALEKFTTRSKQTEEDMVELVMELHECAQAHRIGKALTTAASGESFDILLGYGH